MTEGERGWGARRWQRRSADLAARDAVGEIEEYARHMGHADLLRERIVSGYKS